MIVYDQILRHRLDDAIRKGGHLAPIYIAVRDFKCGHLVVMQGCSRFDLPSGKPIIAVIGDDTDRADGPAGFHRNSVRQLIAASRDVVIVSSAAHLKPYATAATTAVVHRRHATLIETRLEREAEWLAFARQANHRANVLVSTVEPAGGVH